MSKPFEITGPIEIGGNQYAIESRLVENVVLYRVTRKGGGHYTAKSAEEAQAYLLGISIGLGMAR